MRVWETADFDCRLPIKGKRKDADSFRMGKSTIGNQCGRPTRLPKGEGNRKF